MKHTFKFDEAPFGAYSGFDKEEVKFEINCTLLDEIFEPKLFELKQRRARRQDSSRAAPHEPTVWHCLHQRQSGWIPLENPKFVYEAMVPGKTRLDNASISPLQLTN